MYIWILATLIAFFIKGLCGFANTLIFTSILSFDSANANISPVDLILGCPTNLIMVWENHRKLDHKIYLPLSILVLAGSLPGAFLLKNVHAGAVKIVFGVAVIVVAGEMLLREYRQTKAPASKVLMFFIGIIAGLLCGLFGVGALLAAYVNRVTDDTRTFKANISAVFVVENTFRLITYSLLGLFTADILKKVCILIPFALLGLYGGIKSASVLDDRIVKKIVIMLLILSGISLIVRNL